MLETLAIANYRSMRELVAPLGSLTVITGPNASGKSNLYRALRLLSETALGGAVRSIALEGGLDSVLWAGPESFSKDMRGGSAPVQGGPRTGPVRLLLGFGSGEYSYAIDFGLPTEGGSAFSRDPQIKGEWIWHGPVWRGASMLVERKGPLVRIRDGRQWQVVTGNLPTYDSMLTAVADTQRAPEVIALRDAMRSWRFYDQFRTDAHSPARRAQIGTRTPVLGHDGSDIAAAVQTIREIGDGSALDAAVDDAFPGARLEVAVDNGRFELLFRQHGLLRPLAQAELSDGTLRYVLLIAALLTPRPPQLMVLNEPETSLHPDLMPALGRLIVKACGESQVWTVTHSARLAATLEESASCESLVLEKSLGESTIAGLHHLDVPAWHWPAR